MAPIRIENMTHSKFMTVKRKTQDKDGRIYIKEVHTTQSSVFRPDDELVGLESEIINEFTAENIQRLFCFDADANGRRGKIVTIRRTELSENGARKTEELDVEVFIATDKLVIKSNEHTRKIKTLVPRKQGQRPRHQRRNVLWVKPKSGSEQVLLETSTGKFLTVRDGAIVGDWLDDNNQDDFLFSLEPMKAAYSRKVKLCSKIRWNSYWVKASVGSDGPLGMELSEDDPDDHTNVFLRRCNGNQETTFECLLFKNVYLQYDPQVNEADIEAYHPQGNISANLFHVRNETVTKLLYSPNNTSSISSVPIVEFVAREETTGCCLKCFHFFRKKRYLSNTSDSMGSDSTLPSTDVPSRVDTDEATT